MQQSNQENSGAADLFFPLHDEPYDIFDDNFFFLHNLEEEVETSRGNCFETCPITEHGLLGSDRDNEDNQESIESQVSDFSAQAYGRNGRPAKRDRAAQQQDVYGANEHVDQNTRRVRRAILPVGIAHGATEGWGVYDYSAAAEVHLSPDNTMHVSPLSFCPHT